MWIVFNIPAVILMAVKWNVDYPDYDGQHIIGWIQPLIHITLHLVPQNISLIYSEKFEVNVSKKCFLLVTNWSW